MLRTTIFFSFLVLLSPGIFAQFTDSLRLTIAQDEYWWGGLSAQGAAMPYHKQSTFTHDLWGDNQGNQAQPLLVSSKGRFVWCDTPIKYSFSKGILQVWTREGKIETGKAGNNLPEVFLHVAHKYFPPNGEIPDEKLFTAPQFNTWIELQYDQNETDILRYARSIVDNGYTPGVIMVDDTWQEDYGVWDFYPRKFKDPKGMMKKLHDLGFKVMLWMCPFVSPDSKEFRYLAQEGMLLLDAQKTQNILWANTKNKAAIIRWWNGASACLDLSNPKTQAWFKSQLDYLQNEYGVDGFKFDAGDSYFYTNGVESFRPATPNDHTAWFAEIGLAYPLNEYRACWKMAGLPLVQRLSDKSHNWRDLQQLIPNTLAQSLMGYAYTCPDMIGGGQYLSFLPGAEIDEELIVRSAQVQALMPMMQFSVAPWRVLSAENAQLCVEAARLHSRMGDKILQLAKNSAQTGEPIVKPLAMVFPDGGFETVKDQFMLGDNILVAPMVTRGSYTRKVVLPNGEWKSDDGAIVVGNQTIEIEVPLSRIPYFERMTK